MYYIVYHSDYYAAAIDVNGRPNKYGDIKFFRTYKDAENFVNRHTYKGMSHSYEIRELTK